MLTQRFYFKSNTPTKSPSPRQQVYSKAPLKDVCRRAPGSCSAFGAGFCGVSVVSVAPPPARACGGGGAGAGAAARDGGAMSMRPWKSLIEAFVPSFVADLYMRQ